MLKVVVSGHAGEGKSLIAEAIHKALSAAGINVVMDYSDNPYLEEEQKHVHERYDLMLDHMVTRQSLVKITQVQRPRSGFYKES